MNLELLTLILAIFLIAISQISVAIKRENRENKMRDAQDKSRDEFRAAYDRFVK